MNRFDFENCSAFSYVFFSVGLSFEIEMLPGLTHEKSGFFLSEHTQLSWIQNSATQIQCLVLLCSVLLCTLSKYHYAKHMSERIVLFSGVICEFRDIKSYGAPCMSCLALLSASFVENH